MEAVFIDNASFGVTDCNDFIAFLIKDAGYIEPYVAETLDSNPVSAVFLPSLFRAPSSTYTPPREVE